VKEPQARRFGGFHIDTPHNANEKIFLTYFQTAKKKRKDIYRKILKVTTCNIFLGIIMSLGHGAVKRQGSPKALGRDENHPGLFIIKIPLNVHPDSEWMECFRNPTTFRLDSAHPKLIEVSGNNLMLRSPEKKITENIKWVEKYISQANGCYERKIAEKMAERKRQEEKLRKEKEELKRINDVLKEL